MKFKVLKYNQSFMTWIGIYSHNVWKPTNEFYNSFSSHFNIISLALCIISSAIFVFQNPSNLKRVLEALVVMVGCIQALGAYLNIGHKMKKMKVLHLTLQDIADQGCNEAKELLNKINSL